MTNISSVFNSANSPADMLKDYQRYGMILSLCSTWGATVPAKPGHAFLKKVSGSEKFLNNDFLRVGHFCMIF